MLKTPSASSETVSELALGVLEKDCFIITQKNHEDRLRILWLVLRLSQRGGGEDGGNRCEAELSPCAICHIIYGCHVCTESTVVVVLPSHLRTFCLPEIPAHTVMSAPLPAPHCYVHAVAHAHVKGCSRQRCSFIGQKSCAALPDIRKHSHAHFSCSRNAKVFQL